MQQLIARASRSATGALETRDQPERALGKELVCRTGRIEEKEKNCEGRQAQPDARRDGQLARAIGGYVNKMKARHDLKSVA